MRLYRIEFILVIENVGNIIGYGLFVGRRVGEGEDIIWKIKEVVVAKRILL